jgi:hypothetical protein
MPDSLRSRRCLLNPTQLSTILTLTLLLFAAQVMRKILISSLRLPSMKGTFVLASLDQKTLQRMINSLIASLL